MWKYIVVALLFALSACGTSAEAPATAAQQQTVEGLTITLEAPAAPRILDQAGFTIRLADAEGRPVDGADVYLDMTMTTMKMGTNRPVASGEGNGVYRAQGTFDMAGTWEISVYATVAGKQHMALFESTVAEKE